MTTMTRIASTTAEVRESTKSTADSARLTLAGQAKDSADLRGLGLMLGLLGHDRDGSLIATTPWDPDDPSM